MDTASLREAPAWGSDEQRWQSFVSQLEQLRREVEAALGTADAEHISLVRAWSNRFEVVGRGLIHFSVEPICFMLGVGLLWLHKSLELMEIGHMALHGAYDNLPGMESIHARNFKWKAPIHEASWRAAHNHRHHGFTNIEGRDPDLDFAGLRLSPRVRYRRLHGLQPLTNLLTWLGFAMTINLHVTGMIDIYLQKGAPLVLSNREPATLRAARRAFWSKTLRYYGREYLLFPLLAGPFFWKPLLGNVLSEVGRDVFSAAVIYCGHVGAVDYTSGTRAVGQAQWYRMQAEGARNVELPVWLSVLCGGLDKQIEHHLFPRLPPNRLREIAPRVKKICDEHEVRYLTGTWGNTLRHVLRELRRLSRPNAESLAA
ncbi:MAG TPA: fatty acid desaturase [Polyangiaceae bacterium]|jgi:linoleoyl-CoA desaturase|nr:fatty acid desaturase [Polyangiaceae bacterium]